MTLSNERDEIDEAYYRWVDSGDQPWPGRTDGSQKRRGKGDAFRAGWHAAMRSVVRDQAPVERSEPVLLPNFEVCAHNVGDSMVCRCVLARGHQGLHACTHEVRNVL